MTIPEGQAMNPMLITALVAPRQDDLRRSARRAMAGTRTHATSVPPVPVAAWARTLKPAGPAVLAAEPVACRGDAA
jgi:hypothetical protein